MTKLILYPLTAVKLTCSGPDIWLLSAPEGGVFVQIQNGGGELVRDFYLQERVQYVREDDSTYPKRLLELLVGCQKAPEWAKQAAQAELDRYPLTPEELAQVRQHLRKGAS